MQILTFEYSTSIWARKKQEFAKRELIENMENRDPTQDYLSGTTWPSFTIISPHGKHSLRNTDK